MQVFFISRNVELDIDRLFLQLHPCVRSPAPTVVETQATVLPPGIQIEGTEQINAVYAAAPIVQASLQESEPHIIKVAFVIKKLSNRIMIFLIFFNLVVVYLCLYL
jgi:hypothetical protein